MTPPARVIAEPEACPYLGLPDNPGTRYMFATAGHRCHVKAKPVAIDLGHQGSHCLSAQYPTCPRFRAPGVAALSGAGRGRALRRAAALIAVLAVAALAVAIGVGAVGGSPWGGVAPGGVASPSPSPSAAA
ncbi:MAG: hypothetical protein ABIG85_00590, partial [Chloroflexota bacterium]